MKSEVQDASNVRAVVAQALIHNADRVKAYDAIAAVLGESREKAKELVFAYYYDASNSHLLKLLTRNSAANAGVGNKPWRVSGSPRYRDVKLARRFATLQQTKAFAVELELREISATITRVV